MPAGRPRKYQSPEQMQEVIDRYFAECTEKDIPMTVTGLCLALDLDRDGLLKYENEYEEFVGTVKKAKLRIEEDNQRGALTGKRNPIFTIFSLKNNFGWKDKQEVEHTGKDGGPLVVLVEGGLNPDVYGPGSSG
jgi:hypothetical protein